jgi:hypothetical protein
VLEVTHGLGNLVNDCDGLVFQSLLALALHLLNPPLKDFVALHPIDFAIAVVEVDVRGGHSSWCAVRLVHTAVELLQGGLLVSLKRFESV